jgi:hypothetical protein
MDVTRLFIPTSPDEAFYVQRTQLDGVVYQLTFRYNQRENTYRIDLALDDGTLVVTGVKVVCSVPLLYRFRSDPRTPGGMLTAVSSSQDTTPPGLGELGEGRRVQLWYIPAANMLEIQATAKILAFLRENGGTYRSISASGVYGQPPSVIGVIQAALGLLSDPMTAAIAALVAAGTIRIIYTPLGTPVQVLMLVA